MKDYKIADVVLEKYNNVYDYHPDIHKPEKKSRYELIDGVWKQKTPGTPGKALIMCAGDIMCEPVMSEAYYFDGQYFFHPMFKQVKPVFESSDLCFANLETQVSDNFPSAHEMHYVKAGDRWTYNCNAPSAYLKALRYAGFDGFAMANNHACDLGYDGVVDTVTNVRNAEFMCTGSFLEKTDQRAIHAEVNGIRVAMLSYTEFINGGRDYERLSEEGVRVMMNHYSPEVVKKDVDAARADGAEFVIVYCHFHGIEYSTHILDITRKSAQEIADCGADCIMGSHMHAIQGYEVLTSADGRRVPVVYSLSNFISSDFHETTMDNLIYCLELEKKDGKVTIADESYIPCHTVEMFQRSGYVIYPLTAKVEWPEYDHQVFWNSKNRIANIVGKQLKIRENTEA